MSASYWTDVLASELSQGDLVSDAWIGGSTQPRISLKSQTIKGGHTAWLSSAWHQESDGRGRFLAAGRSCPAIVLSWSCEIDKLGENLPLTLAPVLPLKVIGEADRAAVLAHQRYSFFPLPAKLGVLEEPSFVDLRAMTAVNIKIVKGLTRISSASEDGAQSLAAQIVAFFTRINVGELRT